MCVGLTKNKSHIHVNRNMSPMETGRLIDVFLKVFGHTKRIAKMKSTSVSEFPNMYCITCSYPVMWSFSPWLLLSKPVKASVLFWINKLSLAVKEHYLLFIYLFILNLFDLYLIGQPC